MTTQTALNIDSSTSGAHSAFIENRAVLMERVWDANASTVGNTDVLEIFTLPPGTVLLATGVQVLTADTAGNSGTLLVKIDSTSRGSATAPTPVGYPANLFSSTVAQVGTTASKITLTLATGATNGKYRVYAYVLPLKTKTTYVAGYITGGGSGVGTVGWEQVTP